MTTSLIAHPRPQPAKRKLQKVPFVELFDGRLQGVVSSGSSATRVYVSFIEAGTGNFSCATNNNRPCGGVRGGSCKHLAELVNNAIAQYGEERVARFMGLPEPQVTSYGIINALGGSPQRVQAAQVFARFLDYLRYVELPESKEPRPELAWFVTG